MKNKSKIRNRDAIFIFIFILILSRAASAQTNGAVHQIDLPTALRLAGAQNLDVQIAREKSREARANHQSAVAQFFPWISPGINYRQHDGKLQETSGALLEVNRHSYAPGATLGVQLELGDVIYQSLAAKQLAQAADHALEAERQEAVLAAAVGYFALAGAQGGVQVARDAVRIVTDYEEQVSRAAETGLAFKGDVLRARVQKERNQLALRQAQERARVAAARLAVTLHLDPTVTLTAPDGDLAPLDLVGHAALEPLVAQALATRPELRQHSALVAAARDTKNGATYGPLIPTLGAQAFFGGLGGGRRGLGDEFGGQQDYLVGASWRIGPGGLFDYTRVRGAEARLRATELGSQKVQDECTRQVVEAFTRWQSLRDQIETAGRALGAAEEGLRLAQQRKDFAVGAVLETIQAGQDLTHVRLDYLNAVAGFNQAQYALQRATGGL